MDTQMFCRQCEQTARGEGCSIAGVCGKSPDVATLQDLLVHGLKGIAFYGQPLRQRQIVDEQADVFLMEGLFTTVTNVNFDASRIEKIIRQSIGIRERLKAKFLQEHKKRNGKEFQGDVPAAASWQPADSLDRLIQQGKQFGVLAGSVDKDIRSLREILLYGLKGMAAYADHAAILGQKDSQVGAFFYKGLAALDDRRLNADDYVNLIMDFGKVNLRCMEILDKGHTETFGHPVPTKVFWGVKKGPAIIVSGHDLWDLKQLLEQTEGKGILIYTHGEMLPAHGYPELKKYRHFAGHYGTAWQNQQKEFDDVPAVILMTTNCIQKPRPSYEDRIFTTGLVAWPGIGHVPAQKGKKDFSPVIDKALALGGFAEEKKEREITVGFAHHTVLSLAPGILQLVGRKKIRRFFLVGGCDGAKPGRNYYTELAEKIPGDCVILTLACGKFRINHLDLGDVEGIPRLLDCGQCNDAYSAIKIAVGLAEALKCGVNDLPLSLILSWYEQKAVCILLTLLSLGIRDIRLGPSLPAFITPNILNILVEKFHIKPISTVEDDLSAILGKVRAG